MQCLRGKVAVYRLGILHVLLRKLPRLLQDLWILSFVPEQSKYRRVEFPVLIIAQRARLLQICIDRPKVIAQPGLKFGLLISRHQVLSHVFQTRQDLFEHSRIAVCFQTIEQIHVIADGLPTHSRQRPLISKKGDSFCRRQRLLCHARDLLSGRRVVLAPIIAVRARVEKQSR